MAVGRNDPCPCGSGKKYKHCCAEQDARAARAPHRLGAPAGQRPAVPAMRQLDPAAPLEVDAIPLPYTTDDDPTARPVAVLVVAAGHPLHSEMLDHPPAGAADLAGLLAAAVETTMRRDLVRPAEVLVRYAALAEALAPRLAAHGIVVRHASELPGLDAVSAEMRRYRAPGGEAAGPPVSNPATWAAWSLPTGRVAALFGAAAAYYRARPWVVLDDLQPLALDLPGGHWTACVLGNGGEELGLSLYAVADDLRLAIDAVEPADAFRGLRGAVLTLVFERRDTLPRPMQREVAAAHWEVAGPEAYPEFWALHTPGGGVTEAQAADLTTALRTAAGFAAAHGPVLADPVRAEERVSWTDPDTGVHVRYDGPIDGGMGAAGLWELPAVLTPAGAEGANADLAAEPAVVARFRAHLEAAKLSAATVTKHVKAAELFVDYLAGHEGAPLGAATERDLRLFLYDWFPCEARMGAAAVKAVPGSLARFFRYLAEHEGVTYPWADPILQDREAFEIRWEDFPGGSWWDPGVREWQAELYDDLDARAMLPDRGMAGGGLWGESMGPEEAALNRELERRWLGWRDEVIRAGVTEPEAVRAACIERQRGWETARHAGHRGRTPVAVVGSERRREGGRRR